MACFQVDDDGCVLVPIVELELIYGEKLSTAVRLFKDLSFPVYGIEAAQTFHVDILDRILIQTRKVGYFFQREMKRQQVLRKAQELHCHEVIRSLEINGTGVIVPACRIKAAQSPPVYINVGICASKW